MLAGTLRDNIAIGRPGASEEELRAAAAAAGCDFAAADWEREASTDAALAPRLSPSLSPRPTTRAVTTPPPPTFALALTPTFVPLALRRLVRKGCY